MVTLFSLGEKCTVERVIEPSFGFAQIELGVVFLSVNMLKGFIFSSINFSPRINLIFESLYISVFLEKEGWI